MKKLFILILLSGLAVADDKEPKPITIYDTKPAAVYNPVTGKVTYAEDAKPEQVIQILMKELINSSVALRDSNQKLEACLNPPKKVKAAPKREKAK